MPALPHFLRRLSALLLAGFLAHLPAANAALIEIQAPSTDAINGESVSVDLVVSGLGNFAPASLAAFDVNVNYDPAVFAFSSYTFGALLGDAYLPGPGFEAQDASVGDLGDMVNIAEISLLADADLHALQPDAFTLATVTFDVLDLAVGATSQLSLFGGLLIETGPRILPSDTGGPVTFVGRARVPATGTLPLLLGAVLALRLARRR